MSYFEETFIYPRINDKSILYLRYIDDIFFLWNGTVQELKHFIKEINDVHQTIKFDIKFSNTEIHFLDTTVSITPDGKIKTSLYQKPTDRHNLLHQKSYHPSSTKKSLPYSQALRIRRICTDTVDYESARNALREQFKSRGYSETTLNEAFKKASNKDRQELLWPKPDFKKATPLILTTTFNRALPNLKQITDNNWNLLKINNNISRIFTEKPLIGYRRNPNLRQLLGGNKIENNKVVKKLPRTPGKCTPCRSKLGNKCCKQLKSTSTFKNRHTGKCYKIFHRVTCKDRNVIYLLECSKCDMKAYVGKTEIEMNLRMNGHRSDARKTNKLAVDTHFLAQGHHFERDAKFTIIEKITKKDLSSQQLTILLEKREDFWMTKLNTIAPNGFNVALNSN